MPQKKLPKMYKDINSVHSHVRRALECGAKKNEIYHSIILLTSTIGFPAVSAAISWADDIIEKK
jgi:alkylhydroperoxidase/carboxymuconolactone decarboxylase family protein YurZ